MPSKLDTYTSTGVKFWHHPIQMNNYRAGNPATVISAHVSPEGVCNLDCSYCSVHKRKAERMELWEIKQYLWILKAHGLQAVILTGGGEPTAYKHINDLIRWCYAHNLSIGLITNGTLSDRVTEWDKLSWVRVSINIFDGWQDKIKIPKIKGTVGCSFIYTGVEDTNPNDIARLAEKLNAEYIRVLPDCRYMSLELWHKAIDQVFDERFMHQYKVHKAPDTSICHQSYFRPYLHESGYVYPCDSVVLNNAPGRFEKKYRLCHWMDIKRYLNHEFKHGFNPRKDCEGCVFTNNVNMLEVWKRTGVSKRPEPIKHAEFV